MASDSIVVLRTQGVIICTPNLFVGLPDHHTARSGSAKKYTPLPSQCSFASREAESVCDYAVREGFVGRVEPDDLFHSENSDTKNYRTSIVIISFIL